MHTFLLFARYDAVALMKYPDGTSLKEIAMKKMIKTAIVTTSILASASIFAQNVGVNVNGSAQVNVQSGGLISGVAGAVKNTAQGVGHAAQHVGHAAVHTGVNVGSQVVDKTAKVVKNTKVMR